MRVCDKGIVFSFKKERIVFGKVSTFSQNFFSDAYVVHYESGFAIFNRTFAIFEIDRRYLLDGIKTRGNKRINKLLT